MVAPFGSFESLCRTVPSYPWCNLFYRQSILTRNTAVLGSNLNPAMAPVGVNPNCGIPLLHAVYTRGASNQSLGNIANIIACSLSIIAVALLIFSVSRRKAAVGRIEFRVLLLWYIVTLVLQLVDLGSFIRQGTRGLVIVTAIHAGFVAGFFWVLLANAIVGTQVVEDGTLSSLIPFHAISIAILGGTIYIALDVGLSITNTLGVSNPPQQLKSIALFVLTSVWPAAAAFFYFVLMAFVVLGKLREIKPMWYYALAAVLFVLSQLDYFLLNKVICDGSNARVDGSFVATILETLAVVALFYGWRSITEDSWDEDIYYGR